MATNLATLLIFYFNEAAVALLNRHYTLASPIAGWDHTPIRDEPGLSHRLAMTSYLVSTPPVDVDGCPDWLAAISIRQDIASNVLIGSGSFLHDALISF